MAVALKGYFNTQFRWKVKERLSSSEDNSIEGQLID